MIWSHIYNWFMDFTEREKLIREFNKAARNSFIIGETPFLMEASIFLGDSNYKHSFSKMFSGFKIKVLTGRSLSQSECTEFANIVLKNEILERKLVTLGWDTLQIHGHSSSSGYKWRLGHLYALGS